MTTRFSFHSTGDETTRAATRALRRRGLQVERSFHLKAGSADGCNCPHHGTPQCRCQYSVLLVYGPAGLPATLVVHGREDQTQLEVALDPNVPPDARLVGEILAALEGAGGRPEEAQAPRSEGVRG